MHRPRGRAVVAGVVASSLLAAACESPPSAREADVGIDTATDLWSAGGSSDVGGLALQYPRPTDAAIGPDGSTVVIDGEVLFLLGADGRMKRRVTRAGSGPGDAQRPEHVGFSGDSLFWMSDPPLERISWFDLNGDYVTSISRPRQQILGTPWSGRPAWMLDQGGVLAKVGSGGIVTRLPRPLAVWRSSGEMVVIDSLATSAAARAAPTNLGVPIFIEPFLHGEPIVDISPDGKWFFALDRTPAETAAAEFVIRRYNAKGHSLAEVRVPYASLPVTDSLRRAALQYAEAFATRYPKVSGELDAKAVADALWIPDRLPPVERAVADIDGFWIQRAGYIAQAWEKLDLQGRVQRRLRLPRNVYLLAVRGDEMIGSTLDSLGTAVVHKYLVGRVSRLP